METKKQDDVVKQSGGKVEDEKPKATSSRCCCFKRRAVAPPSDKASSVLAPVPHPPSRFALQQDVERALPTGGGQANSTQTEIPRTAAPESLDEMRMLLAFKNEELLESVATRQQSDEALNRTRLERQALHGEVRLLHQQLAQLHACIEEDKRRLEVAERLQAEVGQRTQDAERRMHDSDSRCREAQASCSTAQRQTRDAEYAREEAERKAKAANARAEDAERKEAELSQKLCDCEKEWRLEVDAKTRELELRCTELNLQREAEVRAGLIELHALAQGQQALRTHMLRTQLPQALNFDASSGKQNSVHSRLQTGQQPWEVWEMASDLIRDSTYNHLGTGAFLDSMNRSSLLTGKVKEQAEFLDHQVRDLESRQWSTIDASVTFPGWS